MVGRRIQDFAYPHEAEAVLRPGDYAKVRDGKLWSVRAPNGDMATIDPKVHAIIEHDNGTITVSPSIQFMTGQRYHGHLIAGDWNP